MRRCARVLFVGAVTATIGFSVIAAEFSAIHTDADKRSIVYNPCDETPKPKHCDDKF